MSKVEIKKDNLWFALELITSTELAMRISNGDEAKTSLFEKIISYESLDAELKYLFRTAKEFYHALEPLISGQDKTGFYFESNGKVHFLL